MMKESLFVAFEAEAVGVISGKKIGEKFVT